MLLLVPRLKRESLNYYKLTLFFLCNCENVWNNILEKHLLICKKLVCISYPKVTMHVSGELPITTLVSAVVYILLQIKNNNKMYYTFQIILLLIFHSFVHPFFSSLPFDIATLLRIISDLLKILKIFLYISA